MASQCIHGMTFLDNFIYIWQRFNVNFLVMITMSLHVFLVIAGFFRKRTSSRALHVSIWVAFLSLDFFATTALGLMIANGGSNVAYSLYAPIVLFHLSASDAINAYDPADNELWQRLFFKMVLQTVAAGYLFTRTSCPDLIISGALLFIVGTLRYGERIFALQSASAAHIFIASRPIYKFMSVHGSMSLLIYGERKWQKAYNEDPKINPETLKEVVTFKDIENCSHLLMLMGHSIIEHVCLAFALFKIFRRRLANLHIHQQEQDFLRVREILFHLNEDQIRKTIDLELSFIFDGIFSKSSVGIIYEGSFALISRSVSFVLLLTAMIKLLLAGSLISAISGVLVYVLVIIALVTEVLHIYRTIRSNWMRVWLACNYIREERGIAKMKMGERWMKVHVFKLRVIAFTFRFVGKPKSSHWNLKLGQLSITADALSLVRNQYLFHFKIGPLCDVQDLRLGIANLFGEIDIEQLQAHLAGEIIKRFKEKSTLETSIGIDGMRDISCLRGHIRKLAQESKMKDVYSHITETEDLKLESIILKCHLLTSIFELSLLQGPKCGLMSEDTVVAMCIGLSRYCMHLMIRRPLLMPEDPDVARENYQTARKSLKEKFLSQHSGKFEQMLPALTEACSLLYLKETGGTGSNTTNEDEKIANKIIMQSVILIVKDIPEWEIISKIWTYIVIYIIITAENVYPHIAQMAKGGELLTHLWILQTHLDHGHKVPLDS